MRLLLIRHGETVDNVAQVYAGVKDSALTVHGRLQAERLGKYLAENGLCFKHIFSSDLQRASKTANAIRLAQPASDAAQTEEVQRLQVTALTLLREQDFGSYEGKPFYSRPRNPNISGKENYRSQLAEDPNFKDVESKESMTLRMNTFLQERIIPIIHSHVTDDESSVAVVSHGIILSQLWKCLLGFLSKNSVLLSAGLSVGSGGVSSFEHLGCWSNTGYLELDVQKKQSAATREESVVAAAPCTPNPTYSVLDSTPSLHEYAVVIKTVNGREHLKGLKRTKGGVGSSKFYEGQKSIESFFKKREV